MSVREDEDLYNLFIRAGQPRACSPGEVVFKEGDAAEGVFIVARGSVELRDGDRLIDTVSAPGLFGELALIDNEPRSLTAVASDDVELYLIPTRHFWVLVHETPNFAWLVMSVMSRRLRRAGATT